MKKILFALFLITLLPLVVADTQDLPVLNLKAFPQDKQINLIMDCSNCTSAALCNITRLNYPNSSLVMSNVIMDDVSFPPSFNKTVPQLRQFGWYNGNMRCTENGMSGDRQFEFEITADGNPSQDYPIILVIMVLGALILTFGLTFGNIFLLKYVGATLLTITGLLTIYPGYNYINSTNLLGLAIGTVSIGLGIFFFFYDSIEGGMNSEQEDEE